MTARGLAVALTGVIFASVIGPAGAAELSIGKRSFAVTRFVEDPLVADELTLPSVLHIKRSAAAQHPPGRATEVSAELMKMIAPNLGLAVAGNWIHLDRDGDSGVTGFDNAKVRLKYVFFASEAHEAIASAGLGWEIGGTGRGAVGAQAFDVLNPAVFFGKGLGDLPDRLALLKPVAITGELGVELPTRATSRIRSVDGGPATTLQRNADRVRWGVVFEYNLAYLQSFVKDIALDTPFIEIVPLVEVALETALDRGSGGRTTGTVNPGLAWQGDVLQVAVQAVVPLNERTGRNLGVHASLTFFLDELVTRTLGRRASGH